MKRKYKVGFSVILIFILVALSALYLIKKHKDQANNSDCTSANSSTCKVDLTSITSVESTKTQIGSFGTPQAIVKNVYKNDALGFQVTFSSIWQSAKVTETVPAAPAEGKVEFQLPTTDKSFSGGLATPLTIYVYKSANVPPSADNPLLTKITTSGDLVFEYAPWTQTPSDLGQFTDKEISQVVSNLQVLSK